MIAVITGDIINSRKKETALWQKELKKTLNQYGKEPIEWEIYRGDSFQLKLPSEKALMAAIHFKAAIKQIAKLDVRIGIGLGEQDHKAKKITESTGSAFVNSGACFDNLKKQTLAIKTNNEEFNETLNLMMSIATLIMNSWSNTVSEVII